MYTSHMRSSGRALAGGMDLLSVRIARPFHAIQQMSHTHSSLLSSEDPEGLIPTLHKHPLLRISRWTLRMYSSLTVKHDSDLSPYRIAPTARRGSRWLLVKR